MQLSLYNFYNNFKKFILRSIMENKATQKSHDFNQY